MKEYWYSKDDSEVFVKMLIWLSVTALLMFVLGRFIPTVMWFGIGGLMVSSKQKYLINYFQDIEYTNQGTEFAINAVNILDGWIIKKEYWVVAENFDDAGTAGAPLYFSFGILSAPYKRAPTSDLGKLQNVDSTDSEWFEGPDMFEELFIPGPAFDSEGFPIVVYRANKTFDHVKKGKGIGLQFLLEQPTGVTWTTGDLKIFARATLVVGAYVRGRYKGKSNARPMKVIFMRHDQAVGAGAAIKNFWMAPCDGRINNIRMTVYDENGTFFDTGFGSHFFCGVDVPENIDDVMEITSGEYSLSPAGGYLHMPIFEEFNDQDAVGRMWVMTIHNKNKTMFINKGEPFYSIFLDRSGSADYIEVIEFEYIPNYGNKLELMYLLNMDTGDNDVPWYRPFPLDMYVEYIETDWAIVGVADAQEIMLNHQIHIIKEFDTPSLFDFEGSPSNVSEGMGLPVDPFVNYGIEFRSAPSTSVVNTMISAPAAAGVKTVGHGTDYGKVNDYVPQGSSLLSIFAEKEGITYDLDIFVKVVGKYPLRHDNFGSDRMVVLPSHSIMDFNKIGLAMI